MVLLDGGTVEGGRTEPYSNRGSRGGRGQKDGGDDRAALLLYWMATNWIACWGHSGKLVELIAIFDFRQIFGSRRALELRLCNDWKLGGANKVW